MSRRKANEAPEGVEVRHSRHCPNSGQRRVECQHCAPSFRASIYDPSIERTDNAGRHIRGGYRKSPSSKRLADVRAWQTEVAYGIQRGTLGTPSTTTVQQAWDKWIAGVRSGSIRNRNGDTFKPSVVRGYEGSMKLHVLPLVGARKLSDLKRRHVQEVVDRIVLVHSASTTRNAINPLRALCRWALVRDLIASNPTSGLELPSDRARRERTCTRAEAADLIAVLPERDRALWATAFYAGLRRGELQALRWQDVSLLDGELRVEHSYDPVAGLVQPKSKAGKRPVPVPTTLRGLLVSHRILCAPKHDSEHVFQRTNGERPFDPTSLKDRALKAWANAGLQPIGLHEARHAFGTFVWDSMVSAGRPNPKRLQKLMGHADLSTTMDRYVKDSLESAHAAAADFDAYLMT